MVVPFVRSVSLFKRLFDQALVLTSAHISISDLRTWLLSNELIATSDYGFPTPYKHDQYHQHPPHMTLEDHHAMASTKVRYAHYPGSDNFETAAVYERASRLQTFQFDDGPVSPAPPPPPEVRLPNSTKKKKKKTQRRKSPDQVKHRTPAQADLYTDDQFHSTEDEGDFNLHTHFKNEEEATRSLQKFFFGSSKEEDASKETVSQRVSLTKLL